MLYLFVLFFLSLTFFNDRIQIEKSWPTTAKPQSVQVSFFLRKIWAPYVFHSPPFVPHKPYLLCTSLFFSLQKDELEDIPIELSKVQSVKVRTSWEQLYILRLSVLDCSLQSPTQSIVTWHLYIVTQICVCCKFSRGIHFPILCPSLYTTQTTHHGFSRLDKSLSAQSH